jgi:undecaprenol kinase
MSRQYRVNRSPADPPSFKNRGFGARLGFAGAGLRTVLRREKSFRTQLGLAAAALAAAALLRPGLAWAALIVLAAALVLSLEAVNAALEYLIDCVHPQLAEEIGHAKDAAAGAVLIAAIASALIGVLMLVSVLA